MGMTNDGLSYWQAETSTPLLEGTIGDLLDNCAEEFATQEAVVYSCYPEFGGALDIRWTYREYRDRANAVAKGLMALGLRKGDHIAVWAGNLPEWPLLQMAAAKAGLVLVTINPVLQKAEIEYILRQGDIKALFFMARIRDHDCLATMRALTNPGQHNGVASRFIVEGGGPKRVSAAILRTGGKLPTITSSASTTRAADKASHSLRRRAVGAEALPGPPPDFSEIFLSGSPGRSVICTPRSSGSCSCSFMMASL